MQLVTSFQGYKKIYKERIFISVLLFFIFSISLVTFYIALQPPKEFPTDRVVHINSGFSVRAIAQSLQDKKIIKSARIFIFYASVTGTTSSIKSGDYMFEKKLSVIDLVKVFAEGNYGDVYTRVTIPEGMTNREIADIISRKFPKLSRDIFITLAKDYEGELFPDTYLFAKSAIELDIITKMRETYQKKTELLRRGMTDEEFKQIRIVASLLEREATGAHDAPVIAGIIYKRLRIGMRLQIDATLKYITGKGSSELTLKDLASKSEFNTYRVMGLPPHPINNPGILMYDAAMSPQSSPYLYYLHDALGRVHYATDFQGHIQNKNKYLK